MAANAGRIKAGQAYIEITANSTKLLNGLRAAQAQLRAFGQSLKGIGADFMQLGVGAGLPFLGALKFFSRFDDQMRTLGAISGATDSQMSALEKNTRRLGATTAFTADQIAEGQIEMARMGFEADELLDSIEPALYLVRATGEATHRLGEMSGYAASVLRIFNLRSTAFAHVCDVMAYASNRSATGIVDLAESLKIAGPTAFAINESLEDTVAVLMQLANVGIRGSLAGTSLRKIYQSLAVQSGKTEGLSAEAIQEGLRGIEQLQSMGIKLIDPATGNLRSAIDVMTELSYQAKKLKSGEKINLATDVFDLRGSLGALALMNSTNEVRRFQIELTDVNNYAQETAAKIENGIGGTFRRIFSALQDLAIAIGQAVYVAFGPYLQMIPGVIENIVIFIQNNQKLIATVVAITGAFVALGGILFSLGIIVKIIAFAFGGLVSVLLSPVTLFKVMSVTLGFILKSLLLLKTALLALTTPIGLVIAGATVAMMVTGQLGDAIMLCAELVRDSVVIFESSFADISTTFNETWRIMLGSLQSGDLEGAARVGLFGMKKIFVIAMNSIGELWDIWGTGLVDTLQFSWLNILRGAAYFWEAMLFAANSFVYAFEKMFSGLDIHLKLIWNDIKMTFFGAFDAIGSLLNAFLKYYIESWNLFFKTYFNILESLAKKIIDLRFKIDPTFSKEKRNAEYARIEKEYAQMKSLFVVDWRSDKGWKDFLLDEPLVGGLVVERAKLLREEKANREKTEEITFDKKVLDKYGELVDGVKVFEKELSEDIAKRNAANEDARKKDLEKANEEYLKAKEFAIAGQEMFLAAKDFRKSLLDAPAEYLKSFLANDAVAQETINTLNSLIDTDPAKAYQALKAELNSEREKARIAKTTFDNTLAEAIEDRNISDEEKGRLQELIKEYGRAAGLAQKYQEMMGLAQAKVDQIRADQLPDVKTATENAIEKTQVVSAIGAWSVKALNRMINTSAMDRTAKAAEKITKGMEDVVRDLRHIKQIEEKEKDCFYGMIYN